jgi:hypothetical protein
MAANLAKELGLSESKVKAALEDFMPQDGPHAQFAPTESRRRGGNLKRDSPHLVAL